MRNTMLSPTIQKNNTSTTTSLPSSPLPTSNSKWGPYSSAKDFDVNMTTVLVILVCTAALGFSMHAVLQFLLRRLSRSSRSTQTQQEQQQQQDSDNNDKPQTEAESQLSGRSVLFSVETTVLAGAPDCAICLAELVEGERVRVLPNCSHGFHAQCIEAWLAGRHSCPNCRTDCRPPAAAGEP